MDAGAPLVPVASEYFDAEPSAPALREPPVCGEWSYDDSELEGPRFAARRIDGVEAPTTKATPIAPIRSVPAPRGRAPARIADPGAPIKELTSGPKRIPVAEPTRSLRPTIEALRLAYEHSPSDTARAIAYASALERSGDAPGAIEALALAESAGADAFAIQCARASALGAMLKYDDAAKSLKAAAKLRAVDPEVHVQTGILACRRGRWKDAIEPLQKGIAAAPDNAQAHYYIGEAFNHADRLEEARAAYERAAELDPENWRALKGVGIVLDRSGRSTDAAAWYRRARDAQRG